MTTPTIDDRSPERRARDEQIASEPRLTAPGLAGDAAAKPVESHVAQKQLHPTAVIGVVESGLVRPLDPAVKLPEHSRVIIVTPGKG